ncbi:TetR/AcrR family transcriptional regulator [Microbacterium alcoholitolerans]|uniref:TetR/AcrR family transcriptional regulator n=1 Tax=unclassified Microbacterium TaxID=2609290 RepID=UPI003D177C56
MPRTEIRGVATTRSSRRDELIQIAGKLFAENGFHVTTIRDIADAAGIQSGSLYHHFTSKESMVEELLGEYWTKLLDGYREVAANEVDATHAAYGLIRRSVTLLDECRYALSIMLSDWAYLARSFPFMERSLQECQDIWLDVLERGQREGAFESALDAKVVYRTIMASVSGTTRWFDPNGRLSADQLADEIAALFMKGVNARR